VSDNGSFNSDYDWTEADPAEKAKTKRKISVVSVVISILLVASVIAGGFVVGLAGVLPTWIYTVLLIANTIVAAGLVFLLFTSAPTRHKARFWVSVVLSVLLMAGNLAMVRVGTIYLNTTEAIQGTTTDTVLYDIVVPTSGPDDVKELDQTLMGEVKNDPFTAVVHGQVLQRVKVDFAPSDSWSAMVDSLTAHETSSMVIQDGYMQVLSDADPDTYEGLKIIDRFEVDASLAAKPTQSATPTPTPSAPANSAFVLYISGIDTYGSISNRSRSDVNILMVVNPTTGRVLLVNTPRDFYVLLNDPSGQLSNPSGMRDKLTHSGIYGVDVSVGTIEALYDITIDYYLRINFSSLITVIDALGGVDVNSAYDFSMDGYSFHVGMNHLDGKAALAFSRDRYDFAGGDRVRGQNQQRVIEAIINKATQPSVLMNYPAIMASVQNSIQTSMSQDEISTQVRNQLSTGQKWDVNSISVDGAGSLDYTFSMPGQRLYVMVPDQSTVDLAKNMIQATLNGQ